jgi:hypothetical protein
MATRTIQGASGTAAGTSLIQIKIVGWSAQTNLDVVDTTGPSDGGSKVFEPTAVWMSGNILGIGQFDGTNTAPIPTGTLSPASFRIVSGSPGSGITLTAATGCTYAFDAVVSGVSHGRANPSGEYQVSYDFQSSGPITVTWDQTA